MQSTNGSKQTIRKANKDDILGILVLAKEFSMEAPKTHKWDINKTTNFLLSALTNPNMEIFVSEKEGEVTGAIVCVVTEMYMSNTVIASDLAWFVRKDLRGSPSSIRLLKTFEEWGRSKGANYLGMADIEGINNLSKLYSRLGYSVSETTYLKEA
tara:strand:+ start:10509 stop:10973 length:465 start_codon:yes stop_codon:yes gene_type:complete